MKTIKIHILIWLIIIVDLKAQVFVVENQQVLPELELTDLNLLTQLDSILFLNYPCARSANQIENKYSYFTTIKKLNSNNYIIDILYARPSEIESDINTGIFLFKDVFFIINENNNLSLFRYTGKKIIFSYEKQLRRNDNDSNYLMEIIYPEEFCSWSLSYANCQLKVLYLKHINNKEKLIIENRK